MFIGEQCDFVRSEKNMRCSIALRKALRAYKKGETSPIGEAMY
jgi:hypothetical protein